MQNTIRITIAALAVSIIAACSSSTPVKPMTPKDGKAYVPTGK
jgi:uncharacterized lipoprotein